MGQFSVKIYGATGSVLNANQHPDPKDPSRWRLPAPELETLVASLILRHLSAPSIQANIAQETTTEEIAAIAQRLTETSGKVARDRNEDGIEIMELSQRIQIAPGEITITLCDKALAALLDVSLERINGDLTTVTSEFQYRKHGVETKLILADATAPRDETLFKNIAKAHRYFDLMGSGKTHAEIAAGEGVSKHRIQKLVDLAFLAPDIVRDVFAGSQPTGMTSEWLIRHAVPTLWNEQRDLFRVL